MKNTTIYSYLFQWLSNIEKLQGCLFLFKRPRLSLDTLLLRGSFSSFFWKPNEQKMFSEVCNEAVDFQEEGHSKSKWKEACIPVAFLG